MTGNDQRNRKIKCMIDAHRNSILSCKGANDKDLIIYDGIISAGDKTPDILYLLKEPNDSRNSKKGTESWMHDEASFVDQIRSEIESGKALSSWGNLCFWTKAYEDIKNQTPHSFQHPEVQNCGDILNTVAFVNIKKVAGAEETKDSEFNKTVNNPECQQLIRDEVELIQPKIVICCGTYDYAKKIFGMKSEQDPLCCGAEYFIYAHNENSFCVVDFLHPSCRVKRQATYAYAKEVFTALLSKNSRGSFIYVKLH